MHIKVEKLHPLMRNCDLCCSLIHHRDLVVKVVQKGWNSNIYAHANCMKNLINRKGV